MKKFLGYVLLASLLPFPGCAAPPMPGPEAAVVKNAVENMHSRASDEADVVSQAILGTNVRLLEKGTNDDGEVWFKVQTPDTYQGWISASALVLLEAGDKPYASAGDVFVVSALLANTYREPDVTKRKPVKIAPIGAVLELAAEKDERWLEVRLPCGTPAWIQRGDGDIREAPWTWPRTSPEDMVALSKRFLGLPYLWGGTSPFGLDCSGFVQLVYGLSGIPILRDADIQFSKSGLADVTPGEERAGDLVFFGRAKDRISHVGMMIGPGEFINATTYQTPVVRIDRLAEDYWRKIYQGARRAK